MSQIHLLKFPNELILAIAAALDNNGISRLLCCCKPLHGLLDEYLYKRAVAEPNSGVFLWACSDDPYGDGPCRLKIVTKCIQLGANVNMIWPYRAADDDLSVEGQFENLQFVNPMSLAAKSGHNMLAEMLVKAGAQVDLAVVEHYPPIIIATLARQPDMVRFLLDNNVNLDVCSGFYEKPLEIAAKFPGRRGIAVFEMLLSATAALQPDELTDYRAALCAIELCNGCAVLSLLKSGRIDPNGRSMIENDGSTLISAACAVGHIGVVRILCEHPVTGRGVRDHDHGIAFKETIVGCHFDISLYLLKQGCVRMSRHDWDHSFADVCGNDRWDVAEEMIERGGMTTSRARRWLTIAEDAEYDELTKKIKAKLDEWEASN